jgi:hypothetical protein
MSNALVTKDYRTDFTEAVGELLKLTSEREQLETAIAKQKKRVAALYELAQIDDDGGPISGLVDGLTDACRVVFRAAEKPLFPADVRDRVQALGLPPQANLLASIHTTIKRMKESEEIEEVSLPLQSGGFGSAYQWNEKRLSLSDLMGSAPSNSWLAAVAASVADHPLAKGMKFPRGNRAFYGEIDHDKLPDEVRNTLRPQERFKLPHTKGK